MTTVRAVLRRVRLVIPIAILVSAGAGISAAPPTFATKRLINTVVNGLLPFEVRTADIDQDGDLDIYTANYSGRISWFENDGGDARTWTTKPITQDVPLAVGVCAADLDGDGDTDAVSVSGS